MYKNPATSTREEKRHRVEVGTRVVFKMQHQDMSHSFNQWAAWVATEVILKPSTLNLGR